MLERKKQREARWTNVFRRERGQHFPNVALDLGVGKKYVEPGVNDGIEDAEDDQHIDQTVDTFDLFEIRRVVVRGRCGIEAQPAQQMGIVRGVRWIEVLERVQLVTDRTGGVE